jgi:hypothetical protein
VSHSGRLLALLANNRLAENNLRRTNIIDNSVAFQLEKINKNDLNDPQLKTTLAYLAATPGTKKKSF